MVNPTTFQRCNVFLTHKRSRSAHFSKKRCKNVSVLPLEPPANLSVTVGCDLLCPFQLHLLQTIPPSSTCSSSTHTNLTSALRITTHDPLGELRKVELLSTSVRVAPHDNAGDLNRRFNGSVEMSPGSQVEQNDILTVNLSVENVFVSYPQFMVCRPQSHNGRN